MNKKLIVVVNEDFLNLGMLILKTCFKYEESSKLDVSLFVSDSISKIENDKDSKVVFIPANYPGVESLRQKRKDIFVVTYQETHWYQKAEQYSIGLKQLKSNRVNLSLMHDYQTNSCMVIAPEETKYHETTNLEEAINGVIEMALMRSHLTFTQSIVKDGELVDWNSELVPNALRTVVNYCINQNAYKPISGVTAGHFACKLNDTTFLTSIRKTDFNKLSEVGLVRIETDGPDTVLAYGAKPSVGGQSQRIVFRDHSDCDLIVHFHCPKKENSQVPVVSQREFECGSHECGQNTSDGLKQFGNLKAVYLDNHGPNIVFHHTINPQEVIDFIEDNFDLSTKTGGYVYDLSNSFLVVSH